MKKPSVLGVAKAAWEDALKKIEEDAPLQDQEQESSSDQRQQGRKNLTVSITMKKEDLQDIDAYCKKYGFTRSSFFRSLAMEKIRG